MSDCRSAFQPWIDIHNSLTVLILSLRMQAGNRSCVYRPQVAHLCLRLAAVLHAPARTAAALSDAPAALNGRPSNFSHCSHTDTFTFDTPELLADWLVRTLLFLLPLIDYPSVSIALD
jgi:hypothetical protein